MCGMRLCVLSCPRQDIPIVGRRKLRQSVLQGGEKENHTDEGCSFVWLAVGACGFEPQTSRTRTVRATKLRYAPCTRWIIHANGFLGKQVGCSRSLRLGEGAV